MARDRARRRRHPHRSRKAPSAKTRIVPPAAAPQVLSRVKPSDVREQREMAVATTIVGVGASAGGLDAFSQVLEHLPPNPDVAFVFVQHLSPMHESALTTLLSNKTPLQVVQAETGTRVRNNHVYVIPPNAHMDIVDGELHLIPRPTDRTQFTPIDHFFESLARFKRDRAIGIVLSGTASDGSIGVREIKAMGGITIAQKPETAKYDGMPRAAIATGQIDLVLSPQEIAQQISHVRQHPYHIRASNKRPEDPGLTDTQLREVFSILRRSSSIDFKQYKVPTVRRRLLRRMALLRMMDVDTYVNYLGAHSSEAVALSQDLLIHVTRFFRDPESFTALVEHVFPEIVKLSTEEDPIRIWVPGCATGEEAYSVAIALIEFLGDRVADRRIQIFATDVSDGAVDIARTGTYPAAIAGDVSTERLRRFFSKTDGGYRVIKPLRDMCIFARHDLTRDPPFSRLNLIVCRNVLIYLDATLQRRLMSVFHYALKMRGYLMLGPAETTGMQTAFEVVDKRWRIFLKRPADMFPPYAFPSEPAHAPKLAAAAGPQGPMPHGKTVQDEANRIVLDRYAPAGVVVDSQGQIVQFRGHTGTYLEASSGEPNLNVFKMARGGLLHPLRSALTQARRRSRLVRRERVLVKRNGGWAELVLEVLPLPSSNGHFLILFNEAVSKVRNGRRQAPDRTAKTRESDSRVGDLRRELAGSREYLQSIIQELEAANEELQSANEEILSSNEELQSTNEELDTAKEELQSTNEELNTVNEELHSRNEELTRANSDLGNLLASVDLPIVIVGSNLGIRRFTPKAEQLFNLIPGDLGRPISQINPNFTVDALEGLIRQTIDDVAPVEREVQDRSGRWHSLRIRPYKGADNRLDGAVISLIDIDDGKRYSAHMEQARDYFMAIVETVRQPLMVLDADLRVRSANKSFYSTFRLLPQDTEHRAITDVGNGAFKIPELLNTLKRVVAGAVESVEIDRDRASAGPKRVIVNGRGLKLDAVGPLILVAFEDATNGDNG